jgi:hypothetical protein
VKCRRHSFAKKFAHESGLPKPISLRFDFSSPG